MQMSEPSLDVTRNCGSVVGRVVVDGSSRPRSPAALRFAASGGPRMCSDI
jgi:hypothetical protein